MIRLTPALAVSAAAEGHDARSHRQHWSPWSVGSARRRSIGHYRRHIASARLRGDWIPVDLIEMAIESDRPGENLPRWNGA